jgi:hypothetical protein
MAICSASALKRMPSNERLQLPPNSSFQSIRGTFLAARGQCAAGSAASVARRG